MLLVLWWKDVDDAQVIRFDLFGPAFCCHFASFVDQEAEEQFQCFRYSVVE